MTEPTARADVPRDNFRRIAYVSEGICPTHRVPLEVRGGGGFCEECGWGYSTDGQKVTTILEVVFEAGAGFLTGPGRLSITPLEGER